MPKFKRGETSKSILDKKHAITKSILQKAEILSRISSYEDIPRSLELKRQTISERAVHRWRDDDLGIIAYSRNTAYAKHNARALKSLHSAIDKANKAIEQSALRNEKSNRPLTSRDIRISELRSENEMLRSALAEVYRAYMQLLDKDREDRQIDDAYRQMILDQTRALGRHRLRTLK
jgi:hypothetical protein